MFTQRRAHEVVILIAPHVASVVGHACIEARVGRVLAYCRGMHPETPRIQCHNAKVHLPYAGLACEQSAPVLAEPSHVRCGFESGRGALEGCDGIAEGSARARSRPPQAVIGVESV